MEETSTTALTLREHIRKRPAMYLGGTGARGIHNLLRYFICDIIGITQGSSEIKIDFRETGTIFIKINAKHGLNELFNAIIHTAPDYGTLYLQVLNALSLKLTANHQGKAITFKAGKKNRSSTTPKKSNLVTIEFQLDTTVLEQVEYDFYQVLNSLYYLALLNPATVIHILDSRSKSKSQVCLSFPDGLKSHFFRLAMNHNRLSYTEIRAKVGANEYEMYIGWGGFRYGDCNHTSFANNEITFDGGSLLDGVKSGLRAFAKKKLGNNCGKKLPAITIVASVKTPNPNWYGSTKTKLDMPKVKAEVRGILKRHLTDYGHKNPDEVKQLLMECQYT